MHCVLYRSDVGDMALRGASVIETDEWKLVNRMPRITKVDKRRPMP